MRRRRELTLELELELVLIACIGACMAVCTVACTADTFVGGDAAPGADGGDAGSAVPGPCGCTELQTCCLYSTSADASSTCANTGTTCAQASQGQQLSELGCTKTADCAFAGVGDVCCLWRNGNSNQSACLPTCASNQNQVQLCNPDAADAGCPPAAACSTNNINDWNLPSTFATCGGLGVP